MKRSAEKRKIRTRSPNLTPETIEQIADVIRKWKGEQTWEHLCNEIERQIGHRYRRQSICKYAPIYNAYLAIQEPSETQKGSRPGGRTKSRERTAASIRRLRLRVRELSHMRDALMERFARWAVNASEAGLNEEFLNRPLPPINRSENW